MIVQERETPEGLLVSVCDQDILGETFVDGDVSITVTEEFYGGEKKSEEAVINSLQRATVANIVGTKSVNLAIENDIIEETNVLEIDETLHAQLLRMR
ncbi:DUF424 domain-containing protein [Salinarchaeum sp. IM2453]|uniref:DUF424 domain-containing protein n=1 Tax=Salinarchaeum sp. IM2453 TaxID=2862870 RepID=UPI001C82E83C|nr:DUF424 domain-containing protein [Salinarchaeum sp. IM2453]QZA89680.1 DUF424 domain-containing protein [Salinarchaeum sp. IM2453]